MFSNRKNSRFRLGLKAGLLLLVIVVASQVSSCASPAYYWQAASGHMSLMHARQEVDLAIEQGSLDKATTDKLKLSQEIRSFAIDELGLPDNGSYRQFVQTGRDAVVWNVVAAPEFSLQAKQWCFPVAGCVPYRGYFEEAKAEKFADKLKQQGYEISVTGATAYSTLGWFDDPLLDTMWKRSDAQFAALIFHEMAHQQLYVKGDTRFNESYATFVETIGVKQWLQARNQDGYFEQWLAFETAEKEFSGLLEVTRKELEAIYQSDASPEELRALKMAAFEEMVQTYNETVESQWGGTDYFGGWFKQPPNNARFALLDSYHGGNCAFANLYADTNGNIREFHALARQKSRIQADERHAWLEQPCSPIAHDEEL